MTRNPNCRCGRQKLSGGPCCDHCLALMREQAQIKSATKYQYRYRKSSHPQKNIAARLLAAEAKIRAEEEGSA